MTMKPLRNTAEIWLIAFGLAAGLFLAGCATDENGNGGKEPGFATLPGVDPSTLSGNVLHVGDDVTVLFSGLTDQIPAHEERIKDDGFITLDYIGPVKAAGKTPGELQKEIYSLYVPKYYNSNLNVTVRVEARVYYVDGEVKGPGRKDYPGDMTIVKAISDAGGFTDFARRTKVRLTRAGHTDIINVERAIEDPKYDVAVYPGDKIYVPRSAL